MLGCRLACATGARRPRPACGPRAVQLAGGLQAGLAAMMRPQMMQGVVPQPPLVASASGAPQPPPQPQQQQPQQAAPGGGSGSAPASVPAPGERNRPETAEPGASSAGVTLPGRNPPPLAGDCWQLLSPPHVPCCAAETVPASAARDKAAGASSDGNGTTIGQKRTHSPRPSGELAGLQPPPLHSAAGPPPVVTQRCTLLSSRPAPAASQALLGKSPSPAVPRPSSREHTQVFTRTLGG